MSENCSTIKRIIGENLLKNAFESSADQSILMMLINVKFNATWLNRSRGNPETLKILNSFLLGDRFQFD